MAGAIAFLNWLTFDWWRQQVWLQHIVAAIVTLAAAGVLWFLLSRALTALFKRTDWIQEHLEMLLMRISKWVYWMLAILFALQQGGVDTDSLWTAVTARSRWWRWVSWPSGACYPT